MKKLKSIASLFVNMEEGEEVETTTTTNPTNQIKHVVVNSPSSFKNTETSKEEVRKFVEVLTKEIEESNLDGYDYLEFKESVEELRKDGSTLDEAIKKTFIVVKSLTNVKKIIDSLTHYQEVVKNNKKDFEKNVSFKLEESINKSKLEYEGIQTQIKKLSERSAVLEKEISEKESIIEKNTSSFNQAYELIMGNLEEDKKSIIKVLGDK